MPMKTLAIRNFPLLLMTANIQNCLLAESISIRNYVISITVKYFDDNSDHPPHPLPPHLVSRGQRRIHNHKFHNTDAVKSFLECKSKTILRVSLKKMLWYTCSVSRHCLGDNNKSSQAENKELKSGRSLEALSVGSFI